MKKKKPLQNPVVVVALCCAAGAALYFNTIAPLLKGDEVYYVEEEAEEVQDPANEELLTGSTTEQNENMPEMVSGTLQPESERAPAETSGGTDSTDENALFVIGWRRVKNRNPFVMKDTRTKNDSVQQTDEIEKKLPGKKKHPVKRTWKKIGTNAARKNVDSVPLSAISKGPSGWLALLGNEMVKAGDNSRYGDVVAIDAGSVTIRKDGRLQVVRLPKRKQE